MRAIFFLDTATSQMSIGMVMAAGSPRAAGDPGHYGLKINVQENTQTQVLSRSPLL